MSLNNNYKVDGTTFTEPTLSIRYKFVIRPASEIANRIKDSKADETTPLWMKPYMSRKIMERLIYNWVGSLIIMRGMTEIK